MGMAAKKIIVVPCMVNSRLKVSGETKWLFATASCARMIEASIPPITRKMMPYPKYISPAFCDRP